MIAIMFGLMIILMLPEPKDPLAMKWYKVPPWENCPDCKGEGRIESPTEGCGEYVDCPCTMELR